MTALNLMTTDALRQRRAELIAARRRLDAAIRDIDAAVKTRTTTPTAAHGTRRRYAKGCHCPACTTANTTHQQRYRAARKERS